MNNVCLIGRLTRDPEVTTSNSGMTIARFTLAVDRQVKKDGAEQTADFIGCTAFGKSAEFIEKYFFKGKQMALTGRIQTGSYTNKDGQKVYTTDVIADRVEFCGSKNDGQQAARPSNNDQSYVNVQDNSDDEELPFS